MWYLTLIWVAVVKFGSKTEKLQNIAINILSYITGSLHLSNLFIELKIFKLKELLIVINYLFVFEQLKEDLPMAFESYFFRLLFKHFHLQSFFAKKSFFTVCLNKFLHKGLPHWHQNENFWSLGLQIAGRLISYSLSDCRSIACTWFVCGGSNFSWYFRVS